MDLPRTLAEAIVYFADLDNCVDYLAARRWPKGMIVCPSCGNTHVRFDRKRRVWECNARHPKRQFSIKVGTIFEDSALGLNKWLPAVWMITNMKNGVSSHELARSLGVTQKTAWFMLQRIRLAMQDDSAGKIGGQVEVDETFIGGKARNMHIAQRKRRITGTGTKDKTAVMGKGRREVRLPLPQEVGDAILAYLEHGRPPVAITQVFLRTPAPVRPFADSSVVSGIVARAIRRAGVTARFRGAHVLRHSAATQILRQGASLDQI